MPNIRYVTPVLMYHRIGPNPEGRVDTVTPENFAAQMKYLHRHHYRTASAQEYAGAVIQGKSLSRKSVVITFDDGYADNYTHAWPVLKSHGFSWILFMPSDFIDAPGHLSLDQIRQMMRSGMQVGSHTHGQTYLPDVAGQAQLTDEITQSKKILEQRLNICVDCFSYPIGGFNTAIQEEVLRAGYEIAFTTNRGSFKNTDRLALTRIKVTDRDKGWIFGGKLSGFYNIFRKPRPSH